VTRAFITKSSVRGGVQFKTLRSKIIERPANQLARVRPTRINAREANQAIPVIVART